MGGASILACALMRFAARLPGRTGSRELCVEQESVVVLASDDRHDILVHTVDQAMLAIDTAGPVALQLVTKRFGSSKALFSKAIFFTGDRRSQ